MFAIIRTFVLFVVQVTSRTRVETSSQFYCKERGILLNKWNSILGQRTGATGGNKPVFHFLLRSMLGLTCAFTIYRYQAARLDKSLKRTFTIKLYPPEMMKTGSDYQSWNYNHTLKFLSLLFFMKSIKLVS